MLFASSCVLPARPTTGLAGANRRARLYACTPPSVLHQLPLRPLRSHSWGCLPNLAIPGQRAIRRPILELRFPLIPTCPPTKYHGPASCSLDGICLKLLLLDTGKMSSQPRCTTPYSRSRGPLPGVRTCLWCINIPPPGWSACPLLPILLPHRRLPGFSRPPKPFAKVFSRPSLPTALVPEDPGPTRSFFI